MRGMENDKFLAIFLKILIKKVEKLKVKEKGGNTNKQSNKTN